MTNVPFRGQILVRISDALKTISPDLGYNYDLRDSTNADGSVAEHVVIGKSYASFDAPVPLVMINESLENDDTLYEDISGTISRSLFTVFVQGDIEPTSTGLTTLPAYNLLADVRQRLSVELSRVDPMTDDIPNPFGLGRGVGPKGLMISTGNCIEKVTMSRGIVRGPELVAKDGISPKAHFWFRLAMQVLENAANPYSKKTL